MKFETLDLFEIPGHELSELLSRRKPENEIERFIFRARFEGSDCVTRVFKKSLPKPLGAQIRQLVMEGQAAGGLPEELREVLGGYGFRNLVGTVKGFPEIRDGGLASYEGQFFPYVTTDWSPGRSIEQITGFHPDQSRHILLGLLGLLETLHQNHLAYGDLKPGNVMVDREDVFLVDFDTIRLVPKDDAPVPCTHLTRGWCAPEQNPEDPESPKLLYLASDVFSFGKLIESLLDFRQPQGHWHTATQACLRRNPLDRPQTSTLRAFLHAGQGTLGRWDGEPFDEATERIPDPVQPEPSVVIPPASEKARSADQGDRPQSPSNVLTDLIRSLGLGKLVASLLGIGAMAWLGSFWLDDTDRKIRQAMKDYKTIRELHTPETLDALVEQVDSAVDKRATGRRLGYQALVKVWEQGWGSSTKVWDELARYQYGEAEKLSRQALAEERSTSALLAAGLLNSGACRKKPLEEKEARKEHCELALEYLDEAFATNGRRSHREWLAVEIQWVAAMTEVTLARSLAEDFGLKNQAMMHYENVSDRCTSVKKILKSAPINSYPLAKSCLLATGSLRALDDYVSWGGWMIDFDLDLRGEVSRQTKQRLVTSLDVQCSQRIDFNKGKPISDPRARGDITDLCRYLGAATLGCFRDAEQYWRLKDPSLSKLWQKARQAIRDGVKTSRCLN